MGSFGYLRGLGVGRRVGTESAAHGLTDGDLEWAFRIFLGGGEGLRRCGNSNMGTTSENANQPKTSKPCTVSLRFA